MYSMSFATIEICKILQPFLINGQFYFDTLFLDAIRNFFSVILMAVKFLPNKLRRELCFDLVRRSVGKSLERIVKG